MYSAYSLYGIFQKIPKNFKLALILITPSPLWGKILQYSPACSVMCYVHLLSLGLKACM